MSNHEQNLKILPYIFYVTIFPLTPLMVARQWKFFTLKKFPFVRLYATSFKISFLSVLFFKTHASPSFFFLRATIGEKKNNVLCYVHIRYLCIQAKESIECNFIFTYSCRQPPPPDFECGSLKNKAFFNIFLSKISKSGVDA